MHRSIHELQDMKFKPLSCCLLRNLAELYNYIFIYYLTLWIKTRAHGFVWCDVLDLCFEQLLLYRGYTTIPTDTITMWPCVVYGVYGVYGVVWASTLFLLMSHESWNTETSGFMSPPRNGQNSYSRKRCERVLLKNGSILDHQPLTTARW